MTHDLILLFEISFPLKACLLIFCMVNFDTLIDILVIVREIKLLKYFLVRIFFVILIRTGCTIEKEKHFYLK